MAPSTRLPPPVLTPRIPADHEVILFLHGHSSGAEEAVEIIPKLLKEGMERNKKYSIIAFDLPNNGYSQTFDHTSVAPTEASTYPQLPTDRGPIAAPILDFIEDFVVEFVDALDAVSPIKSGVLVSQRLEYEADAREAVGARAFRDLQRQLSPMALARGRRTAHLQSR